MKSLIKRLLGRPAKPAPFRMCENPTYARYAVGRYSYGFPEVMDWGTGVRLTVGAFCSFAGGTKVMLGGNHHADWVSTFPFHAEFPGCAAAPDQFCSRGDVVIGNDVWVGQDAMILSGVRIGNGAIVGARAVVTRDVPAYAIVVGSPAKVVRHRFPADVVAALESIAWWDWPDDKIRAAVPLLLSGDVAGFIAAHE